MYVEPAVLVRRSVLKNCQFTPDLKQVPKQKYLQWALTGGDDYQLCFTIPEDKRDDFDTWLSNQNFSVTEIGKITPIHHNRSQVKIDGSALSNANGGYEHFKNNPHFSDLLRSPKLLLAFGFGSGLSPKAPGTVGTLAAIHFGF